MRLAAVLFELAHGARYATVGSIVADFKSGDALL